MAPCSRGGTLTTEEPPRGVCPTLNKCMGQLGIDLIQLTPMSMLVQLESMDQPLKFVKIALLVPLLCKNPLLRLRAIAWPTSMETAKAAHAQRAMRMGAMARHPPPLARVMQDTRVVTAGRLALRVHLVRTTSWSPVIRHVLLVMPTSLAARRRVRERVMPGIRAPTVA